MPRVPYYNGGVSSQVMPAGFVAGRPDTAGMADDIGDTVGMLAGRYFGKAQTPAEKELARQRAAAAAVDEQKLKDAQAQQSAAADTSGTLDELNYRSGRGAPTDPGMGTAPVVLAGETPYSGPPATPMTPEQDTDKLRQLAVDATRRGLGAGGDVKQLSPILQSFLMSNGDDAGIVRANAALEGKYLGEDQSPSLARQDTIREDKQQHDTETEDAKLRMQKYGFDTASADRRYNTNVDAGTQRRGQDLSAGTARRGQDVEHGDRVRGQDLADGRARDAAGYTSTTTTTKDAGAPAQNPGFVARMFGAQAAPGRAPSTTKTTVRKPLSASGGRPPLSAFEK